MSIDSAANTRFSRTGLQNENTMNEDKQLQEAIKASQKSAEDKQLQEAIKASRKSAEDELVRQAVEQSLRTCVISNLKTSPSTDENVIETYKSIANECHEKQVSNYCGLHSINFVLCCMGKKSLHLKN